MRAVGEVSACQGPGGATLRNAWEGREHDSDADAVLRHLRTLMSIIHGEGRVGE